MHEIHKTDEIAFTHDECSTATEIRYFINFIGCLKLHEDQQEI